MNLCSNTNKLHQGFVVQGQYGWSKLCEHYCVYKVDPDKANGLSQLQSLSRERNGMFQMQS